MSQYHIEIRLDDCISCGVCYALDPLHFKSGIDGKSHIANGHQENGVSRGIFDDTEIKRAYDAELACPTAVITIAS
ncbi:MAG: ferredoxin [Candidatus Bathyarchaeota archaeon]|nr:ferredoxin [Candidatus Bathyarchaeota archaeon]